MATKNPMKNRFFLLLLAAFLSACSTSKNPVVSAQTSRCNGAALCGVPFSFALANPQLLEKQRVVIFGYIRKYAGGVALFVSKEAAVHSDQASSIWIELNAQKLSDLPTYLNNWVTVTGNFADERKGLSWATIKLAEVGPTSVWTDSPRPEPLSPHDSTPAAAENSDK